MNPLVPDFILSQDALGQTDGSFTGAALFVDISGFTTLTERLAQHGRAGAETLASALRFYFDPLVAAVHRGGGFITSFAGDAFTALFPDTSERDVAWHATQAAARMQGFFREHPLHETRYGSFAFAIRIGLAWGGVHWGIVQADPRRARYYFHGAAIDACARVEHHAAKGEILMDGAFAARLRPDAAVLVEADALRLASVEVVELPPARTSSPPGEGLRFLAPGLERVPHQGEFRSIASVFVSFDGQPSVPDFLRLVHELSERRDGTFTGLDFGDKGGNCLVHFGAPRSHENDIERALDFALELRESCSAAGGSGVPPLLRAGLASGIQYVGFNGGTERREFACLGRATNLAARLMMKAPWGEIWCAPEVHGRAQDHYEWLARETCLMKGFEAPVPVHAVLRKRDLLGRRFAAKEMVGREAELERLAECVEPIFSGVFAGLVYVDGEPGMGKSYLVETFQRRLGVEKAAGSFLWISAPCEQTLQRSVNPFEYALRQAFEQSSTGSRDRNREGFDVGLDRLLGRLAAVEAPHAALLGQELDRLRSVLAALLGLSSEGSLYERLDPKLRFENTVLAIKAWLQAESTLQPVVLHLEDALSADADTIQVLRSLTRAGAGFPIVILCTCRFRDDGAPFRIPAESDVPQHTVDLRRLGPEALHKLAELQLGAPASEALLGLLRDKAAGNPFFAEQILAYLRDQGQLQRTAEGFGAAASDLVLPDEVNTLLIARLDRLTADVKETVQAASALGREFAVAVLSAMLRDVEHLLRRVQTAEEEQIWSAVSEMRYHFRHALLRDAAYEMQARARLRDLHHLAAEAIESVHAGALEEHFAALGHHWERAEVPDKARRHYLAAARKARERYALAEAEKLYRAYLGLVETPSVESVAARNELGNQILRLQGRAAEALAQHQAALDEARRLGEPAAEVRSLLNLAIIHRQGGRMDEAHACFDRALALARQLGDRGMEGMALTGLANLYNNKGDPRQARALFEQSGAIYRELGDRRSEASALSNLGAFLSDQGHLQEALAVFEQVLAIYRDLSDRQSEGILLGHLAVFHERQGRLHEAEALFEQALAIAREVGFRDFEGVTLGNLANLHRHQGRPEQAVPLYERALAIFAEAGSRRFEGNNLTNLADLHRDQGRIPEARALYEKALAIHRKIGNRQWEGITLAYRACLERLTGQFDEADRILEQAEPILRDVGDTLYLALVQCERGHVALAQHLPAAHFLEMARELAQSVGIGPESELGRAVAKLQNAILASNAGQPLFRGQAVADIPDGLRLWLVQTGQLTPS